MGDNDMTVGRVGSHRTESITDKIKQFQKMALGGDVKFSLPVWGNGFGFPNGPKVSDAGNNHMTGSYNTNLR